MILKQPIARVLFALSLVFVVPVARPAETQPIPVKMVVVANFENGADTGDKPGELQFWVEREQLGAPVVHELLRHWARYERAIPQGP